MRGVLVHWPMVKGATGPRHLAGAAPPCPLVSSDPSRLVVPQRAQAEEPAQRYSVRLYVEVIYFPTKTKMVRGIKKARKRCLARQMDSATFNRWPMTKCDGNEVIL
ncbi:uncharacterized protein BJ212DRAFT_961976 [Suillus subaureus]|uniref:Uncharacterized protein n=1 Tax=Suillus subaureus TaxID=48587 RepID=A0A9P7EGM0_9AGAM|nr:uncharacterized protein BJ212DRAFT_961976 [Suillus subaureus]KAG1820819.1 hypothetical protein BJ212DRAFT_961976 [Suillus subaureus]